MTERKQGGRGRILQLAQPPEVTIVTAALNQAAEALAQLQQDRDTLATIATVGHAMATCLAAGGRLYSCGNGGSMCDAMHFAEELTGRFRRDRPALAAIAIADPGFLSCAANDMGWDQVFARFLEAHAQPGDILLAISTSGTSANVLEAVRWCRRSEIRTVGLTGRPGSPLGDLVDYEICAPGSEFADRSQELHIKVIHILIELIERQLFSEASS